MYSPWEIDEALTPSEIDKALTPIQKFYDQQNILITNAKDFIGKLLIEKLLRCCPTIKFIYILIPSKEKKHVLELENELFEDTLFSKLREEQPNFRDRIISIVSDFSVPNLGISMMERETLIEHISIIFYSASKSRFNKNIQLAAVMNVQVLKDVISLSKGMPKLKSFVYVSTVYSQCLHNPIEEKFYNSPIDDINLFKLFDILRPKLIGPWPNTHVYTKSVAENVIKKQAGLIPIGIFRPGIVASTYREPIPGWIDIIYGVMGIYALAWKGIIRTHHCDGSAKVCLVPGDLVVAYNDSNSIFTRKYYMKIKKEIEVYYSVTITSFLRSIEDIPIYNYAFNDYSLTYDEIKELMFKYGPLTPFRDTYWYYSLTFEKDMELYAFYIFLLHLLPGLILDLGMLCRKKQPRFFNMYIRLNLWMDGISYFSLKEWQFTNKRWIEVMKDLTAEDRKLFYCDMKDVDWDIYFRNYLLGVRLYVLKDPIETLPLARRDLKRYFLFFSSFFIVNL
ncbi:hypothetical protein M0802_005217 [Mischocyttarus mexicanus]|nr:hypothetical protein M0802_005217 [Mischocyttarus mexicanus]